MALGSAVVMAIYAAGFARTKPAADRMAAESAAGERRRPAPTPQASSNVHSLDPAAVVALQTGPADSAKSSNVGAPRQKSVAESPAVKNKVKPAAVASDSAEPASTKAHSAASAAVDANTALHATPSAPPAAAVVAQSSAASATPPADPPASPPVTSQTPPSSPPATTQSPPEPAAPAKPVFVDGVYTGYGRSRHGDIEAQVEIKGGRIVGAVISQCLTRYSCSWVAHLPGQVVTRQSAEVDYVSGATESANAFYYAVLKALAQAK